MKERQGRIRLGSAEEVQHSSQEDTDLGKAQMCAFGWRAEAERDYRSRHFRSGYFLRVIYHSG